MKPKQRAFLKAYASTASITAAALAANVDRTMHYDWLKLPGYPEAFADAADRAATALEDEAVRRAHEGVLNPIFYKGKPCGAVREFSDGLMQFLLKGLRPDKYRDRGSVELTGKDGAPIQIDAGLAQLTDDQLAQLDSITRILTGTGTDRSGNSPA